jgi:hypothetical protein
LKIFRIFSNGPSYTRESVLYCFWWHLIVKTSSLTSMKSKYELQYCPLWMRIQGGIQSCSCLSESTDYNNLTACGLRIQHMVMTGHSLLHTLNEPSPSINSKYNSYSCTLPCGLQKSIRLLCIIVSLHTILRTRLSILPTTRSHFQTMW